MFLETKCDSVVGVCEVEHPPHWTFQLEKGRLKPVFKDWYGVSRRQDSRTFYRLNGAIYVIGHDVIMDHTEGVMGSDICPYIMPPKRSIDIDTELTLKLAELLMKER